MPFNLICAKRRITNFSFKSAFQGELSYLHLSQFSEVECPHQLRIVYLEFVGDVVTCYKLSKTTTTTTAFIACTKEERGEWHQRLNIFFFLSEYMMDTKNIYRYSLDDQYKDTFIVICKSIHYIYLETLYILKSICTFFDFMQLSTLPCNAVLFCDLAS